MKADVGTTWRLLRPHAKAHLLGFLLVFVFGFMAAAAERSVFLLLTPTFEALFGESAADAAKATDQAAAPDQANAADAAIAATAGDAAEGTEAQDAVGKLVGTDVTASSMTPEFLQGFLDSVLAAREELMQSVLGEVQPTTPDAKMQMLRRVGLAVFFIAVVAGIFQYLFTWISRKIALLMVVDLRMRLARHLMGLSMRYHDSRKLGDVLSRISADVGVTLSILTEAFRNLILEPMLAFVSLGLAFFIAPLPTLAMVVGLPTVIIPVTLLSKKVRKGSSKSLTKLGVSIQALTQMFQGIRTVKAFRAEERELENFRRINDEYVSSSMKMVRAIAQTNLWTIVFTHGGLGALILVVGWLQVRGGSGFAKSGDMIAFFVLIANVYTNIKKATRQWTHIQETVGASERLQELLDEPEDMVERGGALTLNGLGAGIRLENVSFSYPEGDGAALSNIDLHIKPGETLALVGTSGAGKSTLVDLLARFRDPTEGVVTADGHDLRDLTLNSWTAQYAMVGQTPFLFHATVEENIRYGKPSATDAEIIAAARAADIHDFIKALPEGYKTDVADMGARLSGGQRQRITIARAILKGAPLLLLDEATSALDTETEVNVQAALDNLRTGRTVVVIAHRLSTIREADRIAVMESGRIVEIGSHEALLAKKGAYARLHAAQFNETPVTAS